MPPLSFPDCFRGLGSFERLSLAPPPPFRAPPDVRSSSGPSGSSGSRPRRFRPTGPRGSASARRPGRAQRQHHGPRGGPQPQAELRAGERALGALAELPWMGIKVRGRAGHSLDFLLKSPQKGDNGRDAYERVRGFRTLEMAGFCFLVSLRRKVPKYQTVHDSLAYWCIGHQA